MKVINYEEAVSIVSELANPTHLSVPGGDAYEGSHPRQGDILVILNCMNGAVIHHL